MSVRESKKDDILFSITKYIVEEHGVRYSVKLQKILYFLYLDYLKEQGKELFKDEFEAWIYGPVLTTIFYHIKNFGMNFSEIEKGDSIEQIEPLEDKNIKDFIDRDIKKYINEDTAELVEKTHKTTPWIEAREGLNSNEPSNKKITKEEIKKYVSNPSSTW